jgi:hypothetical protein
VTAVDAWGQQPKVWLANQRQSTKLKTSEKIKTSSTHHHVAHELDFCGFVGRGFQKRLNHAASHCMTAHHKELFR